MLALHDYDELGRDLFGFDYGDPNGLKLIELDHTGFGLGYYEWAELFG